MNKHNRRILLLSTVTVLLLVGLAFLVYWRAEKTFSAQTVEIPAVADDAPNISEEIRETHVDATAPQAELQAEVKEESVPKSPEPIEKDQSETSEEQTPPQQSVTATYSSVITTTSPTEQETTEASPEPVVKQEESLGDTTLPQEEPPAETDESSVITGGLWENELEIDP